MNSDLENFAIIIIFSFSFFFDVWCQQEIGGGDESGNVGDWMKHFMWKNSLWRYLKWKKSAASLKWIRAIGMPIKSDNINNSNLLMFALSIRPFRSTTRGYERRLIQSLSTHMDGWEKPGNWKCHFVCYSLLDHLIAQAPTPSKQIWRTVLFSRGNKITFYRHTNVSL